MGKHQQELMYEAMREHATSQEIMSNALISKLTGWGENTFRNTNYGKYYRDFMEKLPKGYRVYAHFLQVTRDDFFTHVTQSNPYFGKYKRSRFDRVSIYEFLLPLTREDKLRIALDNLFFKDAIVQLAHDVNIEALKKVVETYDEYQNRTFEFKSIEDFRERLATFVGDLFGGYSIHHVNGRYKTDSLITSAQVSEWQLRHGRKYIHDETTACVRFIIPLPSSKSLLDDHSFPYDTEGRSSTKALYHEYALIRALFFEFFAETIVRTVRGEEEIWLLEHTNEQRLYVWEKTN